MAVAREIKLETEDGVVFSVPRNIILQSVVITNLIKDLGLDSPGAPVNPEPIQLKDVESRTFRKVLEWCEHHVGAPPTDSRQLSPWDAEYVKVDQTTLFEIILAANNLEIRGLLDTCFKAIADIAKGKSPEELREFFGIENDSTSEEEAALKAENNWVPDDRDEPQNNN